MLVKQKIKDIQTLSQKKFREETGLFIAEGPKIVEELIREFPGSVAEVFALKEWIEANGNLLAAKEAVEISEEELKKISLLSTPNRVLATVRQFPEQALKAAGKITLALDGIQDPGNLGTLIRIADWFGIDQIVCSPDTADLYNSKVVQATMGSIGRVPVQYADLPAWLTKQESTRIYAAVMEGQDISTINKIKDGIILIGNESKGIREEALAISNVKITIPKKGKAESLNAAIATAVILSHVLK